MEQQIPKHIYKTIYQMQKNEISAYHIYKGLAKRLKNAEDKQIILEIAKQEASHAALWKSYTKKDYKPNWLYISFFKVLGFLLGYTFTLKLMEKAEDKAQADYEELGKFIPEALAVAKEEDLHEEKLINMLNEERLNYVGSIVLGLNDALVELTGALAGLTFALTDTRIISLSGLITGIAASLSMAGSEYLSAKADGRKDALKSAIYTGTAYIITVALLILPYLLLASDRFMALGIMLTTVVLIIFFFNYYISVAKSLPFKKRFFQMTFISLGVAVISFGIGLLIKQLFGIDI